jgi:rhodanese-related sulfurtransferase
VRTLDIVLRGLVVRSRKQDCIKLWLGCAVGLLCVGDGGGQTNTTSVSAVAVARMYKQYQRKFIDVPEISPRSVLALIGRSKIILVDVRSGKEQSVSMLPGAITRKQFESRPDSLDDRTIVAYCTIGYRSGVYAKQLRKQGLNALNLEGGILGWAHAGGRVVHAGEDTKRIHVYGKKWDLLPAGYESVR